MDRLLEQQFGLEEAASYFKHRAHEALVDALLYERAALLYGELIMDVDPPPGWKMPHLPKDPLQLITQELEVLPEETLKQLEEVWRTARERARRESPRLGRSHIVECMPLAGHVTDLHTCIEAVANRHLLYQKATGAVSGDVYKTLDRANLLPKLLYLFKAEFENGKLHLGHFKHLSRLRNDAVHYKAASRSRLSAEVVAVLNVNKEAAKLFGLVAGEPSGEDYRAAMQHLENQLLS